MGPSHAENFKKSTHTPTFKKPLKARLLLFDLFVQSEPAMLMGPRCPLSLIACLKSNTGPKSAGYPLGHRRMPFFWWQILSVLRGEAIGAFPHFARVFSSVAQSKRLVGERSCHASHSLL